MLKADRAHCSFGWVRCQVGRNVSPGVQDAPDVDVVVVGHVEDDVGEFLERPAPETWYLEFEGEAERPSERISAEVVDRGFERIDEVERGSWAGFVVVVGNRGFDIAGREGAKGGLHRETSGVGNGAVSKRCEVRSVGGADDGGAGAFEEGGSELATGVVASDQIAHVLARRCVAPMVDLGVDEALEIVRERHVHRGHRPECSALARLAKALSVPISSRPSADRNSRRNCSETNQEDC